MACTFEKDELGACSHLWGAVCESKKCCKLCTKKYCNSRCHESSKENSAAKPSARRSVVRGAREICRMLKKEGCRLAAPISGKQSYAEED